MITLASSSRVLLQQHRRLSQPSVDASASAAEQSLKAQLSAANLRITQLLATPECSFYNNVLRDLEKRDREFHVMLSEFRYTQMALTSSHNVFAEETRFILSLAHKAASGNDGELDKEAVRIAAAEMLKKNLGFRTTRVSEEAPIITTKGSEVALAGSAVRR